MHRNVRLTPVVALLIVVIATILAAPAVAGRGAAQSEEVRWRGVLAGMEFIVTFTPADGGSGHTATIDIPAQGLSGGQLTDVVYSDTEITFTLPIAPPNGATWRATREAGAPTAAGELEQGVNVVPFTMELVPAGEDVGPARPQTPEPPFPYRQREVAPTRTTPTAPAWPERSPCRRAPDRSRPPC